MASTGTAVPHARRPVVSVEIWSDVVCPWCYIGKRRFERAAATLADEVDLEIVYRPYQLDPTAPSGAPVPVAQAYATKFGGPERAAQILDLVRGDYLTRRENVLFVGPSGTGKTHLATALAMAACAQGKKVRFWRVTELITTLREAEQDRHLLRLRQQLAKLDLLVLDEFGYGPASKAGAELLFDVIATAYERSSIVLTTNLGFEQWTEILGPERLTGAALDRLTHRCVIVETTGESYRLHDAKRRRRSEPKS